MILLCLLAVVLQTMTISSGAVNEEYVFADAAEQIASGDPRSAGFFRYQANSLGLPLLAAALLKIMPSLSGLIACRLTVLFSSMLALLLCGRLIDQRFGYWRGPLWLVLLLVNPIVWCMLRYGTADLLPGVLVTLGLLATLQAQARIGENYRPAVSLVWLISIAFFLATVLKVHAFYFASVSALSFLVPGAFRQSSGEDALSFCNGGAPLEPSAPSVWRRFRLPSLSPLLNVEWRNCGTALIVIAPPVLWILGYGFWTKTNHGFFLVPSTFQSVVGSGWLPSVPFIFACYLAFLGILFGPLLLYWKIVPTSRIAWTMGFMTCILAMMGSVLPLGELNLGPATEVVPLYVVLVLYGLSSLLCSLLMLSFLQQTNSAPSLGLNKLDLITCVGFLLVMSFTRPAQRYLIFVFPILLLHWVISAAVTKRNAWRHFIVTIYVVVFGSLSLLGQLFLSEQGNAARRLVTTTAKMGILCQTDLTVIRPHVGDGFRWCGNPVLFPMYRVDVVPRKPVLVERIAILGFPVKTFYLNPSKPSESNDGFTSKKD